MASDTQKSKGVFIGWSGSRSGHVAKALKYWLQCLSLDVEPWVSNLDLRPGTHWWEELETQLQVSSAGILCVSPEGKDSPWLHFEAGALARSVEKRLVIPYAIDMNPSAIPNPIQLFQSVEATRPDTYRMIRGLFSSMPVEFDRESNILDVYWPLFQHVLNSAESESDIAQAAIEDIERAAIARRHTQLMEVLFPRTARRGEPIQLQYVLETRADDVKIWLGASLLKARGEYFVRVDQDEVVTLKRGERRFRRTLTVDGNIESGDYNLNAELWFGPRSNERLSYPIQRKWPAGRITVE